MTRWFKTEVGSKYGVAIYNFQAKDSHCLSLNIGDTVDILEETDAWFMGNNTRSKSQKGIFPKSFIQIKQATISMQDGNEKVSPQDPPLVQEITSTVREWDATWKQLFVLCQCEQFDMTRMMMIELLCLRTRILSHKLTSDELKDLQYKVTSKIDWGNAILGLDLIVRNSSGQILNPDTSSAIHVFRQHVVASEHITSEKSKQCLEAEERPVLRPSFNIYVMLRNFICRIGEEADLVMTLYDAKIGKFISENYVVKMGSTGMPKMEEMFNNLTVLFTDLGSKDRLREKVLLVCQIIRIGAMDLKDIDIRHKTQNIRRPFGAAVMDITEIIQGSADCNDEDKHYFIPYMSCGEKDFLENIIKKATAMKEISNRDRGQGLWISMKVIQGDTQTVIDDYPHLILASTILARKMGFPEVIMPGDVRNDIYVTLISGEFNKGGKASEKNVEVTMHVCKGQGDVLSNVIYYGAETPQAEYSSSVYYHEDRPRWNETLKVAISTDEDFHGLHLRFSFRHRSSMEAKDKPKHNMSMPFAISFIKLMNQTGTTLADTVHDLLVYKIEKKMPDAASYLDLPATRAELDQQGYIQSGSSKVVIQQGGLVLSNKDSIQIGALVCSTKLTHNVDLLGLLKWQEIKNAKPMLRSHLESIMKVDGEEIVKFLQDLLDALFNILMETSSEHFENLVFDALVYIISLISDRKYHQFRQVLDVYIDYNFSFAMAYNKLLSIFKQYIDSAADRHFKEQILRAMKAAEYIFKIIIRSRLLFKTLNQDYGRQQFDFLMKQLLQSINNLMLLDSSENIVLVQGAAMKYIPRIVSNILEVFDPLELSYLLADFFKNIPQNHFIPQKLTCLHDMVKTDIFKRSDCRCVLLPVILKEVKVHLELNREVETCANILSQIMDTLHSPESGSTDDDILGVSRIILRTVIQTIITKEQEYDSTLMGEFVAVMIAILRQMSERHYTLHVNGYTTDIDLLDFLIEIMMLFQNFICRAPIYPLEWIEMLMLQNSVILRALRFFAGIIKEKFFNPFEQQLWSNFFHCAISFLTQDSLQLHTFSLIKRNKIISKYGDMRREMGFEIRAMWSGLGANKTQFIPQIVGLFLEMTLIPEAELRKATIPLFYDMMQCEFFQPIPNSKRIQGNFNQVEHEMVTKLDSLVEAGYGDDNYKDLLHSILYKLCDNSANRKDFHDVGVAFVDTLRDLLIRLTEYRHIMHNDNKEHRMSCIVNLLNFYREIGRQEMYVRYLQKLCDLHLECDNYTEAAYTLILYSKLLQWSDEPLQPVLSSAKYSSAMTHRDLKENLYYDIIDYFDRGKMWEKGIEICKELANQYENELFDYQRLSEILKQQAAFFDYIMKQMRPEPEYFRVGYYGKGFPSFLQNKVFIYRGKEYERLADFNSRLQKQFPNAQLMRTLSLPGDDILQSPDQYLQINAVSPVMRQQSRFKDKNVSEPIIKYYTVNEVNSFTYSRPVQENSHDITTLWLERKYLDTGDPLPGILRWFEVTSTQTVQVTPLENAVETIESKNTALKQMLDQHHRDPGMGVDALSRTLNGVVDPTVNGGIVKYKVFYMDDYLKTTQSDKDAILVKKLKDTTSYQIELVKEGLRLHKRKAPDSLRPFHAHMEERFAQLSEILKNDYGIRIDDRMLGRASLKRIQSMPSALLSPPTNHNARHTASTNNLPLHSSPGEANTTAGSAPVRLNPAARTQSVWVKAEKSSPPVKSSIQSRVGNMIRRASHITELTNTSLRMSDASPIQLSEQLTPKRPPRPDIDKRSSRHSGQFKDQPLSLYSSMNSSSTSLASNASTTTNTDDDLDSVDEPPPLPEKQSTADYCNLLVSAEFQATNSFASAAVTKKDKPAPPLPFSDVIPPGSPPILPKKLTH